MLTPHAGHCKFTQMIRLNLPPFDLKVKRAATGLLIFDMLRQRYVPLTPEEWVRQHFVHYLTDHLDYPARLMANEVSIRMPGSSRNIRRCDTVLYHKLNLTPHMIMEYKAPTVNLSQAVFNQLCAYNSVLRAPYLVVSNGLLHYCLHLHYGTLSYEALPAIPRYGEMQAADGTSAGKAGPAGDGAAKMP